MKLPLYLRFALILTLALSILGVGSLYTSWSIWKNLSQSYALSQMKAKFDRLSSSETQFPEWEITEWAFEVKRIELDAKAHWLKIPHGKSPEELEFLAGYVLQDISETKTSEGSFERDDYFIFYKGDHENLKVLGTLNHLDFKNLQPWTLPYLSLFWGIFLSALFLAFLLTLYINRSYKKLRTAVETISTGRYENVSLPKSSDPELSLLTESIEKMITLLDNRDEELSKISQIASEDPLTKLPKLQSSSKTHARTRHSIRRK
jgi:hypothetical protein